MANRRIVRRVVTRKPQSVYVQSSPQQSAVLRALKEPLFDTEVYPQAGATKISLFQKPQGQNVTYSGSTVQKTEWHTNLNQSSQLGQPNEFDLYGFAVELESGVNEASHIAIYKWGVFKFFFGVNPWLTIPLSQIPQRVSIDGFGGSTAYLRQGTSAPNSFYNFTIGKTGKRITSNESFHVELTFPAGYVAAYADTYIRCYLIGVSYRQL